MENRTHVGSDFFDNQAALWRIENADLNLAANTDIPFVKQGQFSEYYAFACRFYGASQSLVGVQFGIFTGPGGTGKTIIAAGATFAGMTTTVNTGTATIALTDLIQGADATQLYFRLTVPKGSATTLRKIFIAAFPTA